MTDDGEPLYDSVASEDDYTYVEQVEKLNQQKKILEEEQKNQRQLNAELVSTAVCVCVCVCVCIREFVSLYVCGNIFWGRILLGY